VTSYQLPVTNYRSPRYQVIPRVLCFVTLGDDVLLLKDAANKRLWAGKYNGLGGHVERGESVHAAALREIQEEAAIEVTDLRLRGVVTIDLGDGPGIGLFVFTAKAAGREFTASAEGALEWVPLGQAPALDSVEDLPTLISYLFSLPPDAPPFGAHYQYDAEGKLVMRFFSGPVGLDRPL
jgi:8-oxo-dGTP diphosphatase